MSTRSTSRTPSTYYVRVGIFIVLIVLAIIPALSVSSASLGLRATSGNGVNPEHATSRKVQPLGSTLVSSRPRIARAISPLLMQAGIETITVYQSDCMTESSSFVLGDQVCIKITGAPLQPGVRRLAFLNGANYIVNDALVNADGQTLTFTLPNTATTALTPQLTVDNRGRWQGLSIGTGDGYTRAAAPFIVLDPNQAVADLGIGDSSQVEIAGTVRFTVFVANNGPQTASNVEIVDAVPSGATFDSVDHGPEFTCAEDTGTVTCQLGTLASGATKELTFVYGVAGVPVGTEITHEPAISSATTDNYPANNTSIASEIISSTAGAPEACVLDCPSDITQIANATQGGNPGAFVTFSSAEGIGTCGEITTSSPSGSFFPVGETTVNVTSTTGGGSCSFKVNVVTTGAPTISCPDNKTVSVAAGETSAIVDPGTPTTNPSTNVSVSGVRSDNELLTDPYPIGTTHITWTVTDGVGLTGSCTQLIIVNSATCDMNSAAPTVTAPPNVAVDTPAGIFGSCGLVVGESELGSPDTTGACTVNVVRTGVPAGNFFPVGTTTITYTATDTLNRTATATQTVTVSDKTAPIIAAPADASYVCPSEVPAANPNQATRGVVLDENGNPLPPGPPVDNCGVPVVTVSETSTGAGSAANPKIITRTFTATDAAGNSASDVQTITVADGIAPTISAPANASYQCASEVPAANPSAATASDNCAAPTVTVSDSSNGGAGTTASPLVITRTFTATDGGGNTAQAAQIITVIDNTAPVISCPSPITVYLPLNSTAVSKAVNFNVTATDNCNGTPTVTTTVPSGYIFPVGTTTVNATATDAAGNQSTCSFSVTVLYNFSGFFPPIDNLPVFNEMKAGQGAPVRFSLSGDKGANIFAANSPSSVQIACTAGAEILPVEETVTAGSSSLTYDPTTDKYNYVWKTETSWKNTCRQLNVVLNDGTTHSAKFKFK